MARIIVALDVEGKVARMAAVEAAAKSYSILDLAEEPVAPEEGPAPAVERLLGRLSTPPDDVVGLFGLQQVSLRTLTLPFSDRKRIDQVLPFELEGVFPFDPEELAFNYVITRGGKKGEESELLVGAARKTAVAESIEAYREAGHDPRHLWLDGFALEAAWRALAESSAEVEEPVDGMAYLHIGAESSLLTLTGVGSFRSARHLRTGTQGLVKRWAEKLGLEPDEFAERLKAGGSREECTTVLQPLLREVELTMRSVAKTAGMHPVRLGISGEITAWPGMAEAIANGLGLPAERLVWSTPEQDEPVELGNYAPLVGAAMQTRLPGGLDLRCGEFTYTRTIQLLQGKLLATGSLALVLLLLVLVGDMVSYFTKNAEAERIGSEIRAVFQETFPNEPLVDPAQQMQIKIREMRQQVSGSGSAGVVDTFRALSTAVDDDVNFVIREFFKDRNGYRVRAETDSYETVDLIRQALNELPDLPAVTISDSRSSQRGVEFDLVIGGGS